MLCVRRPSVRETRCHRVIWLADSPAARLAVANDNMAEVGAGMMGLVLLASAELVQLWELYSLFN